MGLSIRERADTIGTYRFVAIHLMETLARWVPSTPELEVKIFFGRHIWDFAQHADALGRRTAELRSPLHFTRPPSAGYRQVLAALVAETDTAHRVRGLYDGLLPDLEARYRGYLDVTDRLVDEPSVRVLDRMLADYTRWRGDRDALARERPDLGLATPAGPVRIGELARAVGDAVDHRPAAEPAEAR